MGTEERDDVLAAVEQLLLKWGWVQHRRDGVDGFDLVGAFEEVSGEPLHNATPAVDKVLDTFGDPGVDRALAAVATIIGADREDGDLPNERWVWVHRITTFNDSASIGFDDVREVLRQARLLG